MEVKASIAGCSKQKGFYVSLSNSQHFMFRVQKYSRRSVTCGNYVRGIETFSFAPRDYYVLWVVVIVGTTSSQCTFIVANMPYRHVPTFLNLKLVIGFILLSHWNWILHLLVPVCRFQIVVRATMISIQISLAFGAAIALCPFFILSIFLCFHLLFKPLYLCLIFFHYYYYQVYSSWESLYNSSP